MDTHSSARQEPNDVEANATMTMRKKWGMSIVVFGLVGSVLSIATASWVQFAADGRLLCSQPACAQHPNALWVLCSVVTFVQCLLTLLAFSTAGRFTAPLSSLARAAERIGRGEPDVAVPVGGSMEVRTLGLAFQAILMELDASRAKAMQAQKLAAIGQRASGIAHEINNPLAVILGFAKGMERRMPDGDALREPVEAIVREALRCKNLAQELLAFSRVARKDTELVDLNAVVRSSAVLLDALAKAQGVEVVRELAAPLPSLRANHTQLQQVVVNLGTNALDAMGAGGTLTLRTRMNGSGLAVLAVADTGCGIPEAVRPRIFEPFFTTKEVGKGTGLGLSLVHDIVQQHGGEIAIASQPGKGTEISVQLPVAAQPCVGNWS